MLNIPPGNCGVLGVQNQHVAVFKNMSDEKAEYKAVYKKAYSNMNNMYEGTI